MVPFPLFSLPVVPRPKLGPHPHVRVGLPALPFPLPDVALARALRLGRYNGANPLAAHIPHYAIPPSTSWYNTTHNAHVASCGAPCAHTSHTPPRCLGHSGGQHFPAQPRNAYTLPRSTPTESGRAAPPAPTHTCPSRASTETVGLCFLFTGFQGGDMPETCTPPAKARNEH